jgi:uncharacterized protein YbjT (DUF2867 family)
MSHPIIFVTGTAGKTGRAVVLQLLRKGWPAHAAVRAFDSRSERLRKDGAEVVAADLFDPELLKAMLGTSRAYYCPPWHPYMLQSAVAFAVAARQARLRKFTIYGRLTWRMIRRLHRNCLISCLPIMRSQKICLANRGFSKN